VQRLLEPHALVELEQQAVGEERGVERAEGVGLGLGCAAEHALDGVGPFGEGARQVLHVHTRSLRRQDRESGHEVAVDEREPRRLGDDRQRAAE
jgi:hypothetical protein